MNATSSSRATWPTLLDLALPALDSLPPDTVWSWGGGTALAIRLDHRLSRDIDIFLESSEALRALSPQRNPIVRAITDRWQEPGNYLKLERDEGEIDFIVSATFTRPGVEPWPWNGRSLPLETASEVLAKKLHWRGSRALARDVFDFAAARRFAREAFDEAIAVETEGARRVAHEIRRRVARLKREMPQAVDPTDKGVAVLEEDWLDLAASLDAPS